MLRNLPGDASPAADRNKNACDGPDLVVMPFGWEGSVVSAGFSGRSGGVSPAPFDSLNLSFQRADPAGNVLENHRRLLDALGHASEKAIRARQVHGARIAVVDARMGGIHPEPLPMLDGVDGLLTNEPGLLLLTSHADCVPVYLHDPVHRVVGLVHAGWGGVLAGVAETAMVKMRETYGTDPGTLRVGFGPHIRPCCFEVREDVAARFRQRPWWSDRFLVEINDGQMFLDLEACLRAIFQQEGVGESAISSAEICTCCEKRRFFSHRGSGGNTGTGNAWIQLRSEEANHAAEAERSSEKDRTGPGSVNRMPGLLALLFAFLMLATGCSNGLNGRTGTGNTPDLPVAEAKPIHPATGNTADTILLEDKGPAKGGTLRLFMQRPTLLDPLRTLDAYVMDYGWFIYDPLVRVGENGRLELLLAQSILPSQDGRVWDITLRKDVLFHDGTKLTAEDVAFSILHARDAGSSGPYSDSLSNLESAEEVGNDLTRLILKVPDLRFSRNLGFPILPAHSWTEGAKGAEGSLKPIGTGAYHFVNRDDEGLTLERNSGWWNLVRPGGLTHEIWPDAIRFVFGNGEAERITFFQQRRIDVSWTQTADKSRYANRMDLEYREYLGNRFEYAILGSKGNGVRNPVVRTLLLRYLAACAQEEGGLSGAPVVAAGLEPLSLEAVVPLLEAAGCKIQKFGEDRQVLSVPATAGWRQASLNIRYDSLNLERLKTAEWMTDRLGRLGVAAVREEATQEEERKLVLNGQFDMLLLGSVIPAGMAQEDMHDAMRAFMGGAAAAADVMPLYREQRAMLYNTRIRGEKKPSAGNEYGGWPEWYLLTAAKENGGS